MTDEEFDELWTSCEWRQEIDRLRNAIRVVCEGWTLPPGARKVLEAALWAESVPNDSNEGPAL